MFPVSRDGKAFSARAASLDDVHVTPIRAAIPAFVSERANLLILDRSRF